MGQDIGTLLSRPRLKRVSGVLPANPPRGHHPHPLHSPPSRLHPHHLSLWSLQKYKTHTPSFVRSVKHEGMSMLLLVYKNWCCFFLTNHVMQGVRNLGHVRGVQIWDKKTRSEDIYQHRPSFIFELMCSRLTSGVAATVLWLRCLHGSVWLGGEDLKGGG